MQLSFPWDDVHLFLMLYRSRTMGEAAGRLGVNISTVSRRLSALEDALDAALFDRGRDGLSPTVAAEALLVAAEQAEGAVAAFANAADTLEREVSGTVRIACPPDMAEVVVLPLLQEVMRQHPQLRIVLSSAESLVDLVRREADVALRTVRPTRGDLLSRRVLTIQWVPAAAPDTISKRTDPGAWPWIGWDDRVATPPPGRWLDRQSLEPVLRTPNLRTQIAAAQAGFGVALVPHPSVDHYGLVPLELPPGDARDTLPRSDVFLVTHRTLRQVPRVRVVWDSLLASLEARFG